MTPASQEFKSKLQNALFGWSNSGWNFFAFDSLESTMDAAKQLKRIEVMEELPLVFSDAYVSVAPVNETFVLEKNAVILTRGQSGGRGRLSRSWQSKKDFGIYATYVFRSDKAADYFSGFSLAAGVAVGRMLERLGVKGELKWPNDVLVLDAESQHYRKLSGILVELTQRPSNAESPFGQTQLGCGIGLNLEPHEALEEFNAAALVELLPEQLEPEAYFSFFADLSYEVVQVIEGFVSGGFGRFRREWLERSMMLGRRVSASCNGGLLVEGTVSGVDRRGGLILQTKEAEEQIVYSGEVNLLDVACN